MLECQEYGKNKMAERGVGYTVQFDPQMQSTVVGQGRDLWKEPARQPKVGRQQGGAGADDGMRTPDQDSAEGGVPTPHHNAEPEPRQPHAATQMVQSPPYRAAPARRRRARRASAGNRGPRYPTQEIGGQPGRAVRGHTPAAPPASEQYQVDAHDLTTTAQDVPETQHRTHGGHRGNGGAQAQRDRQYLHVGSVAIRPDGHVRRSDRICPDMGTGRTGPSRKGGRGLQVTWSRWRPASAQGLTQPALPAVAWRPVPVTPWPGGDAGPWIRVRAPSRRRPRLVRFTAVPALVLSAAFWALSLWPRPGSRQAMPARSAEQAPAFAAAAPRLEFPGGPGPAAFAAVPAAALRAALAAAEPPLDAPRPSWLSPALQAAAKTTGLPVALLAAVAQAESQGNPRAVSPAGALGLMQLMPNTAAALGVRHVFDAAENALAGAEYLAERLAAYDGGVRICIPDPAACPQALRLALAAYNAGPGAVARYHGVPPYPETQRYVREVTALYLRYRSPG